MVKRNMFNISFAAIIIIGLISLFEYSIVNASEIKTVDPIRYEMHEAWEFDISKSINVSNGYSYGQESLCRFVIGTDSKLKDHKEYNGYRAFGLLYGDTSVNPSFDIKYIYNDQHKKGDDWVLCSSSSKTLAGYDLKKKIDLGAVLVLSSNDSINWEVDTILTDYFDDNESKICSIPHDKIINGKYFRVLVAYQMKRKGNTGTEYKNFVEEYRFYLCSDLNYVYIKDLKNLNVQEYLPQNNAVVDMGFVIIKNGSNATVTVKKDNNYENIALGDNLVYREPGKYKITITTGLNTKYEYNIEVKSGSTFVTLNSNIYTASNDYHKDSETPKSSDTVHKKTLTTIYVYQQGTEAIPIQQGDIPSLGIKSKAVGVYMTLNSNSINPDWKINKDTYGSAKENIYGVVTGEVGSGALIVKKSLDGKNWENVYFSNTIYENGLYTTDYTNNFGYDRKVLIYLPEGEEVINGVYIKIYYAYKVTPGNTDTGIKYIEENTFYLCNNNLGAIRIVNNTKDSSLDNVIKDYLDDETAYDIYKKTESIESGEGTTTGFIIDNSENPKATIKVFHNGKTLNVKGGEIFDDNGMYKIEMKSEIGSKRECTIYVDNSSAQTFIERNFGDSKKLMKRCNVSGKYPTFEGGVSKFKTKAIASFYMPMKCTVYINGEEVKSYPASRFERTIELNDSGFYTLVFETCNDKGENISGDSRKVIYKFNIIDKGTSPKPSVNKNNLEEYGKSYIQDFKPIYYGFTFSSAGKGKITLAFENEKDAKKYATKIISSELENYSDNEYRFYNLDNPNGQKVVQKDGWETAEAVKYYTDQAVELLYFDLSSSSKSVLAGVTTDDWNKYDNKRQLELNNSVVMPGVGQVDLFTNNGYPLINEKTFEYQEEGLNGKKQKKRWASNLLRINMVVNLIV